MQRPASRAGISMPQSIGSHAPISAGYRPNTAQKNAMSPSIDSNNNVLQQLPVSRPMTSSGRPPTGMRPPTQSSGTKRPPTGTAGTTAAILPSTAHTLNVTARPVTSQGVGGIRLGTGRLGTASKRTIADKSYYITELRTRISDIELNIQEMKNNENNINSNTQQYNTLKVKHDSILKDIRQCEGELADMNLSIDKYNNHININELTAQYQQHKLSNVQRRQQVDAIYMKYLQHDKSNQLLQKEINAIQQNQLHQIQSTGDHELIQQYNMLLDQLDQLNSTYKTKQQQSIELNDQYHQLQYHTQQHQYTVHQHGVTLKSAVPECENRLHKLQNELNSIVNLNSDQLKQYLTQRVKQENNELTQLSNTVDLLKNTIESLQQSIQKCEHDVNQCKLFAATNKYQHIIDRDTQINEFLQSYDNRYHSLHDIKQQLAGQITDVMNQIHDVTADIGIADIDNEQNNKIDFNDTNVVQQSINSKQIELTKLQQLSDKISHEIRSLNEQRHTMQLELDSHKSTEQLQSDEIQNKKRLLSTIADIKSELHTIKSDIEQLSIQHSTLTQTVTSHPLNTKLIAAEQRLHTVQSTVKELAENVEAMKHDTDYMKDKITVLQLTESYNTLIAVV